MKKTALFTPQFILLCASNFLFFASFNMIIPELPAYLSALGGEDYKGLIIALFTLTAGLSRPFSGKLADNIGRVPVMLFGGFVCVVCGVLYPMLGTVWGFLLLRFFHGFSTGFQPTGQTAYIADIVPPHKRGEAMGIIGFMSSIAMAFGPVLGSSLALYYSMDAMFYVSSFFAFLAALVVIRMPETLHQKKNLQLEHVVIRRSEIIDVGVFPAAFVWMLCVFSFGVVLTLIPDVTSFLGIENKGTFFGIFTLSSLLVRLLAGRLSDLVGRVKVLKVSCLVLTLSMIMLGASTSVLWFYASAVLFGIGVGINSPTVMAWLIDLSDDRYKGRGIATGFIALEIGIGCGALAAGWMYGNNAANFANAFWFASGLAFVAYLYLLFYSSVHQKRKLKAVAA